MDKKNKVETVAHHPMDKYKSCNKKLAWDSITDDITVAGGIIAKYYYNSPNENIHPKDLKPAMSFIQSALETLTARKFATVTTNINGEEITYGAGVYIEHAWLQNFIKERYEVGDGLSDNLVCLWAGYGDYANEKGYIPAANLLKPVLLQIFESMGFESHQVNHNDIVSGIQLDPKYKKISHNCYSEEDK